MITGIVLLSVTGGIWAWAIWLLIRDHRAKTRFKRPHTDTICCGRCGGFKTETRWDEHMQRPVCVERDLCHLMVQYKKLLDKV